MRKVIMMNEGKMPHYRVPVYNYLDGYLRENGYSLIVSSEGAQEGSPHVIRFRHEQRDQCFRNLRSLFKREKPDAALLWLGPHMYMIPLYIYFKWRKIKVIHWGHRRPMHKHIWLKNILGNLEHWMDDAVVVYAEDLRRYIWNRFQSKTFVANNTLNLTEYKEPVLSRDAIKHKYNIPTAKNVICMGRMHRRKRIEDLVEAFRRLNMDDVGLILVGPDPDRVLSNINGRNIFKLGPVHGDESLDLLSASDVYCLPGAVGLSIVDAFYCGLPLITENVVHGPEIMYLKHGINGFITSVGDIAQLTSKLRILLTDNEMRSRFSAAARDEIMTSGHIENMCKGFLNALQYVCGQEDAATTRNGGDTRS
jgi:glycosyltransferase involved in cell wall biosynthesis